MVGAFAFIGAVNRDKILAALDESWWGYLVAAIFVLCGLVALRLAVASTVANWRYGGTVLRLDTLPAYIGDRFRGTVEAKLVAPRGSLEGVSGVRSPGMGPRAKGR